MHEIFYCEIHLGKVLYILELSKYLCYKTKSLKLSYIYLLNCESAWFYKYKYYKNSVSCRFGGQFLTIFSHYVKLWFIFILHMTIFLIKIGGFEEKWYKNALEVYDFYNNSNLPHFSPLRPSKSSKKMLFIIWMQEKTGIYKDYYISTVLSRK